MIMHNSLIVRPRGVCDYLAAWKAMADFTSTRQAQTVDEIWPLQHFPVFTLGLAGREEHVLDAGDISVIKTDRGGQATYHGPGQLIVYLLLDLDRIGLTVKRYVYLLEESLLRLCRELGVDAQRRAGAPGVYVAGKKIAALGIRVRHGCSYHGLALNVDMDLQPFQRINPCGYAGLEVTQLADLGCRLGVNAVFDRLLPHLEGQLGLHKRIPGRSPAVIESKSSRII